MPDLLLALASAGALAAASARWNWWRPRGRGLPVLMYHKVGEAPAGSRLRKLWVSAAQFRWQMGYLRRHGYETLAFSELKAIHEGRRPTPARAAVVTFDDGYANNAEVAFPIMKELGVKGNIFLVYETMDRHNAWHDPASEAWIRMLTWAQARELQDSGLVEFGSHTMRHRQLSKIPPEEARWELAESKLRLEERLGREVCAFAYPYGDGAYVDAVRRLALSAGYLFDFSIKQGFAEWPWRREAGPLRRLFIRGDDFRCDFHLNMTRGKARL